MKVILTKVSQRFWEYVNQGEWWECWNFHGSLTSAGYGILGRGRRGEGFILAHRLSYEMHYDSTIPRGLDVCHECNNRQCVNPSHLYVGTRSDNMQQAKREGRLKRAYKAWSVARRERWQAKNKYWPNVEKAK